MRQSTAVPTILIDSENLIMANIDDSRAILCKNGKTKHITVDHERKNLLRAEEDLSLQVQANNAHCHSQFTT